MAKSILSFTQKIAVRDFLAPILLPYGDPDNRQVQFIDEWTDERVAAIQPFNCSKVNVSTLRKECFGELARTSAADSTTSNAIAKTNERLDQIEKVLSNLVLVVNGLSNARVSADKPHPSTPKMEPTT